jgi:hypothetical protein
MNDFRQRGWILPELTVTTIGQAVAFTKNHFRETLEMRLGKMAGTAMRNPVSAE